MYGNQLLIPVPTILTQLHGGHQGITKCRQRATQSVWWPGISKEIQQLVENCQICCQKRINHPEPLYPPDFPQRPWQKVATDLMEYQKSSYLVVTVYYSRYVELALLSRTSASVIEHLKSFFACHGVPETVVSDNGSQYKSTEFQICK